MFFRCKNGGTCIDGIDGYTCSCPADLTGDLCECLIITDSEQNCSYIAPTHSPQLTTHLYRPTHSPHLTTNLYEPTTHLNETTTHISELTTIITTHPPSKTPVPSIVPTTEPPETTTAPALSQVDSTESSTKRTEDPTKSAATSTHIMETTTGGTEILTEPFDVSTVEYPWVDPTHSTKKVTTNEPGTESLSKTDAVFFTTEGMGTDVPLTEPLTEVFTRTTTVKTTGHPFLDTTSELFFPTEGSDVSSTDVPSCRKIGCHNGGLCLNTTSGVKVSIYH